MNKHLCPSLILSLGLHVGVHCKLKWTAPNSAASRRCYPALRYLQPSETHLYLEGKPPGSHSTQQHSSRALQIVPHYVITELWLQRNGSLAHHLHTSGQKWGITILALYRLTLLKQKKKHENCCKTCSLTLAIKKLMWLLGHMSCLLFCSSAGTFSITFYLITLQVLWAKNSSVCWYNS